MRVRHRHNADLRGEIEVIEESPSYYITRERGNTHPIINRIGLVKKSDYIEVKEDHWQNVMGDLSDYGQHLITVPDGYRMRINRIWRDGELGFQLERERSD